MLLTVLQFNTLSELANYSKMVNDKGYRINVQHLTLKCKLSTSELDIAVKQYRAKMLEKIIIDA